jgi:GTP-binding protein Era
VSTNESKNDFRCGFASIIGRPNVGKSTLLNRFIGQKLSITSRKPQTTQRRILGIKNSIDSQLIFIDTPGMQSKYNDAINQYMHREIMTALADVNIIIFVLETLKWTEADEQILDTISAVDMPVLALINKIDKSKKPEKLLPYINDLSKRKDFVGIIPVSAKNNINIENAEKVIASHLPVGPAEYPPDQLTDRSERFMAAEFIREKLVRKLGKELPYRITVTIEKFVREEDGVTIEAIIWVESASQKSIVIGKDGHNLKVVGERARKDLQIMLDAHVLLRTWVKIKKNWSDDSNLLKQFGFEN